VHSSSAPSQVSLPSRRCMTILIHLHRIASRHRIDDESMTSSPRAACLLVTVHSPRGRSRQKIVHEPKCNELVVKCKGCGALFCHQFSVSLRPARGVARLSRAAIAAPSTARMHALRLARPPWRLTRRASPTASIKREPDGCPRRIAIQVGSRGCSNAPSRDQEKISLSFIRVPSSWTCHTAYT
jgi:hypothetical protein